METIFTNATVVTPSEDFHGTLVVENGRIRNVDTGKSDVRSAINCEGDILMPGIIDLHTDNLEKHFQPRQGVTWDAVGAAIAHDGQVAAAGITTVFDSLSVFGQKDGFNRTDNLAPMIEGIETARDHDLLRIDHKLHLRCELSSPDLVDAMERHLDTALLGLLSMMDHSPGQRQNRNMDEASMLEMMKKHGKTEEEVKHIQEAFRSRKDADFVVDNRKAVLQAAQRAKVPLASHDDETPDHVAQALADGATIAEFPVTIEASQLSRDKGMIVIMGAPNLLRGGSHSGNVSVRDVVEADAMDALASDYLPLSMLRGAFMLTQAPFNWPLAKAVKTVTAAPAAATGLTDRGEISVDKRGDIVRVRRAENGWPQVRETWCQGVRAA